MKKLAIILGFVLGPVLAIGQNSNEIFDSYRGVENVTSISITKYMFSLFSDVESNSPENQEFLDLVKTLDGMKILQTEDAKIGKEIHQKANKYLSKEKFKELMSIDEKDKQVLFSIKEEGKKVSELVMLVYEKDGSVVFMSISGKIDLKKISQLSKKMNISGLDNLEGIDNNKKAKK